MSNLGAYQVMTTIAKKVGGPVKLAVVLAVSGYVVIRTAEGGIKTGIKKVKKHKEAKAIVSNTLKLYTVNESGESNEGLIFNIGDTFIVLDKDSAAVLIEKIGDTSNPYFVSEELIRKISDYN